MKVSIVGATGYVGYELTRLLSKHPYVELTNLISQSFVGKKYSDVYPNLRGICDIECTALDIDRIIETSDLVITALPHGISKEVIPPLIEAGITVIDHSGDFRYNDIKVYEEWYHTSHGMTELNDIAVYGMPELYRSELKDAKLVGNPGCYPTCSILPLVPLLKEKIVKTENIIIDAASGVTGAGRKADVAYGYSEVESNFKAYGVATHRHTSEIEQELSLAAMEEIKISFTPHLAPFKRGMMATTYANLNGSYTAEHIHSLLEKYYADEYFIRVLPLGVMPEVKNVAGSNFLDIGVTVDERLNRVILISAQDNLMKGAAGQAVQVLNIIGGFDETTALESAGLYL